VVDASSGKLGLNLFDASVDALLLGGECGHAERDASAHQADEASEVLARDHLQKTQRAARPAAVGAQFLSREDDGLA
jgi:hypothetical protein